MIPLLILFSICCLENNSFSPTTYLTDYMFAHDNNETLGILKWQILPIGTICVEGMPQVLVYFNRLSYKLKKIFRIMFEIQVCLKQFHVLHVLRHCSLRLIRFSLNLPRNNLSKWSLNAAMLNISFNVYVIGQ